MKPVNILLLFAVLLCDNLYGQSALIKYIPDTTYLGKTDKNLRPLDIIAGNDSCLYILAAASSYYPGPGMLCRSGGERGFGFDLMLYKVKPTGEVVWQHMVSHEAAQAKIISSGNWLSVYYTVSGDNTIRRGEKSRQVFRCIILDKSGEKELKTISYVNESSSSQAFFYTNSTLLPTYWFLCPALHKDNTVSYITGFELHREGSGSIDKILSIQLNDTTEFQQQTIYTTIKHPRMQAVLHDATEDEYIVADTAGLDIYNGKWQLVRQLQLPGLRSFKYPTFKIAVNENYYVVNYGDETYSGTKADIFTTAVLSKEGKIVSVTSTPHYYGLKISRNNIIYSVPYKLYSDSSMTLVTLTATDLHQNTLNEWHIGQPQVVPDDIFLDGENRVIVTGTCTQTPQNGNFRKPQEIYLFSMPLIK